MLNPLPHLRIRCRPWSQSRALQDHWSNQLLQGLLRVLPHHRVGTQRGRPPVNGVGFLNGRTVCGRRWNRWPHLGRLRPQPAGSSAFGARAGESGAGCVPGDGVNRRLSRSNNLVFPGRFGFGTRTPLQHRVIKASFKPNVCALSYNRSPAGNSAPARLLLRRLTVLTEGMPSRRSHGAARNTPVTQIDDFRRVAHDGWRPPAG